MPSSLISLGANLGNVLETMRSAGRLIREAFPDTTPSFSRIYRTPPVGGPTGQGDFLNAMARVEHNLSVWQVWKTIQRIESDLGRQRNQRWESRRIDIDLILHESTCLWTPHLKIPHPRMCMRSFVLQPAFEIAPDLVDPVSQWSIEKLACHLSEILSNPSRPVLAIGCNSIQLTEGIRKLLRESTEPRSNAITITHTPSPEQWIESVDTHSRSQTITNAAEQRADLRIACVETPDPESIQWEDYSAPWAMMLGLQLAHRDSTHTPQTTQLPVPGPRYLLPGNDLSWAVHEILAASQAMRCPIEPTDYAW